MPALKGEPFEGKAISVRGVTPGGSVALLSIAKRPNYYRAEITHRRELLVDSDVDGLLTYQLDEDVPATSVWTFVDVLTGAAVVAMPESDYMHGIDFPLDDSIRDEGDEFVLVRDKRKGLEVLYTRPLLGAWHAGVLDDGPSDRDRSSDGHVQINLSDLKELGEGTRKILDVLPGDLVIGLDRFASEYFVLQLDGSTGRWGAPR